jgi:hypothetical protein
MLYRAVDSSKAASNTLHALLPLLLLLLLGVCCSVGFNAIYHLTDVPSFVSGEHLVRW